MTALKTAWLRCDYPSCTARFEDDTPSITVIRRWARWKKWETGSTHAGLDFCPDHRRHKS